MSSIFIEFRHHLRPMSMTHINRIFCSRLKAYNWPPKDLNKYRFLCASNILKLSRTYGEMHPIICFALLCLLKEGRLGVYKKKQQLPELLMCLTNELLRETNYFESAIGICDIDFTEWWRIHGKQVGFRSGDEISGEIPPIRFDSTSYNFYFNPTDCDFPTTTAYGNQKYLVRICQPLPCKRFDMSIFQSNMKKIQNNSIVYIDNEKKRDAIKQEYAFLKCYIRSMLYAPKKYDPAYVDNEDLIVQHRKKVMSYAESHCKELLKYMAYYGLKPSFSHHIAVLNLPNDVYTMKQITQLYSDYYAWLVKNEYIEFDWKPKKMFPWGDWSKCIFSITYDKDKKKIVFRSCLGCMQPGMVGRLQYKKKLAEKKIKVPKININKIKQQQREIKFTSWAKHGFKELRPTVSKIQKKSRKSKKRNRKSVIYDLPGDESVHKKRKIVIDLTKE